MQCGSFTNETMLTGIIFVAWLLDVCPSSSESLIDSAFYEESSQQCMCGEQAIPLLLEQCNMKSKK